MRVGILQRLVGFLLVATFLLLPAVTIEAQCDYRCLVGVNYALCASGHNWVDCEIVSDCNPGCAPYNADCCSYWCEGTWCFLI